MPRSVTLDHVGIAEARKKLTGNIVTLIVLQRVRSGDVHLEISR